MEAEQMFSTRAFSAQQAKALHASMATVLRRPPIEQERLLDAIEQLAAHRYGGVVERRSVTALRHGHLHRTTTRMRPKNSRRHR